MEGRNPWFSIWTQPRATISRIVLENPNHSLWWLGAIYGFCSLMNLFQSMLLANAMSPFGIILLAVVLAPFYGVLSFTIWSAIVFWVGKWFRGQGGFKGVRAAYAWSCVPMIVNVPLWLLMAALFGRQLFLNFPNAQGMPNSEVLVLFLILIAKVILAIWSFVIYLNALAQVQSYSILRAILNVVVAAILMTVVVFVLWTLLMYAIGGAHLSFLMLWKPI